MKVRYSNNASTVLNSPVEVGHTVMIVASASQFPILSSGDWMYVTVEEEVIKVTNTSGNVFTCEAFNQAHGAASSVEGRITIEVMNDAQDADIYDTASDEPDNGSMRHGEMFVNTTDLKFGIGDPYGNPIDIIAVKFHSLSAKYYVGDIVVYGLNIWRCIQEHTASVFNNTMWVAIGSGGNTSVNVVETSGAIVIDVSLGDVFTINIAGATSIYFTGFESNLHRTVMLILNSPNHNITWSPAVKWPGGSVPTLSAYRDRLVFCSEDGGFNIDGGVCGVGYV